MFGIQWRQTSDENAAMLDDALFRQQALIANLWVILATIAVSAVFSLPFAPDGIVELGAGFALYFSANSLALWFAYRGAYRAALIGFTIQVYVSTLCAMILMNQQPAHMVLAMANFVLLHAVVLGRRWALTLTAVMVSLLVLGVIGGEMMAPMFSQMAAEGAINREMYAYTEFVSLLTTAFSTGYIIVTTSTLQQRSRMAMVAAHRKLEETQLDLQLRHDRARLLSELGASAAAARDLDALRSLVEEAINTGLPDGDVAVFDASSDDRIGILIGTGQRGLILAPQRVLADDDMRFLRTLAGLIDGAYTRMIAELSVRESKRFEDMGRLATGVAHDFNNLLMPICASYELLRKGQRMTSELESIIEPGQAASEQARALIEKLLVHAKSTGLKLELVNMNRLIKSSEMLLKSFLRDAIELRLIYPEDDVFVMADRIELQQVLLNLTLNAYAAVGNEGRVSIELSEAKDMVNLAVIDDGPGIPPELREWVLKPFNTTNPAGSGLGLATVERIANAGGGDITIGTDDAGGARVTFSLPLAESVSSGSSRPMTLTQPTQSLHALIVEDDELVRTTLVKMLVSLGHSVVPVNDGHSALENLQSDDRIDLVVSDYQMPGLTGVELVERMRAVGDRRPVILLTGYGSAISDSMDFPVDAVLGKPVSLEELNEAISQVYETRMAS